MPRHVFIGIGIQDVEDIKYCLNSTKYDIYYDVDLNKIIEDAQEPNPILGASVLHIFDYEGKGDYTKFQSYQSIIYSNTEIKLYSNAVLCKSDDLNCISTFLVPLLNYNYGMCSIFPLRYQQLLNDCYANDFISIYIGYNDIKYIETIKQKFASHPSQVKGIVTYKADANSFVVLNGNKILPRVTSTVYGFDHDLDIDHPLPKEDDLLVCLKSDEIPDYSPQETQVQVLKRGKFVVSKGARACEAPDDAYGYTKATSYVPLAASPEMKYTPHSHSVPPVKVSEYTAPRPEYVAQKPIPKPEYTAPKPEYTAPRPEYTAPRPEYTALRSTPKVEYTPPKPTSKPEYAVPPASKRLQSWSSTRSVTPKPVEYASSKPQSEPGEQVKPTEYIPLHAETRPVPQPQKHVHKESISKNVIKCIIISNILVLICVCLCIYKPGIQVIVGVIVAYILCSCIFIKLTA